MGAAEEKPIWQRPVIGTYPDPSWIGLSGLERMQAFREGRVPLPPIVYLTEILFTSVSAGHVGFQMPASPWFANATGLIPGGMAAVLADAPLGSALDTDLPPGIEAFLIDEATDQLLVFTSSRLAIFPPLDPIPDPPAELPVIDQPFPGSSPEHPLHRPLQGEVLPQSEFERLSGREMLEGWVRGELPNPPVAELIGFRVTEAGDGEAEMTMPCTGWLSTALGTVQGGFIAMLAELTMTSAVFSTVEPGTAIAPLDLKVNFMRPVPPDGRDLTAKAEIVHRGRTISITSCRVTNADGKAVALATGSAMYLPGRPANLLGIELRA
jgi:uncharacterized protein (TIGR00369 family)